MQIRIHATAGARRNHVGGSHDGVLRVSVTASADKGRANKAIRKSLADAFNLTPSQITLISGAACRRKLFLVSDSPAGLERLVAERMSMR